MLRLNQIRYHPPASPQPILQNINLEVESQTLGLIIGPSGSGKSTLLEIMAGLANPTKGDIFWRTQKLNAEERQELAGLVFQFPERHFCGKTILEELRLGHPELDLDRVYQALEEVGLADISLNLSPDQLSGGQQRRVALAVQLIRQPNILMLDEPTAGLDWSMRQNLINLLKKLKQHWTLLVVTHDPEELLDIADRRWCIDHGTITPIDPSP
ncbi:MAG: ABC transporter ATP-binding protein [Synechococcaceae cyanobacterium RL_1_2]|nr:ABC transporter ATP-binding protein [Synechococcaceae cyanobacterium RL_1_2]